MRLTSKALKTRRTGYIGHRLTSLTNGTQKNLFVASSWHIQQCLFIGTMEIDERDENKFTVISEAAGRYVSIN